MDKTNTQFEQELNKSAELIKTAKNRYRTLEGAVPIEFIEALSEIEDERNNLKTKINVNENVQATAKELTQRAQLLSDFLDLIAEYEDNLIEQDIYRQQCWVEQLDRDAVRAELDADTIELLNDISQWVGIFQNLIASESHESIRTNSQKTISELEQDIRATDHYISNKIPASLYETVCIDTTSELLDDVHDGLSRMEDTHLQREEFGAKLQSVKSMKSSSNPDASRIALEGTIMVFHEVSRAVCRQEHAKRLADAIDETTIRTDIDTDACASKADVNALLGVVTENLQNSIEQSESARLRRLLSQHDGSVSRTMEVTNEDTKTVFEQLRVLYEDDQIADLVARIDT